MRVFLSLFLLLSVQWLFAQATATLRGTVSDANGVTLPLANVSVIGTSLGTSCNELGDYRLDLPAGRALKVQFSYSGAQSYTEEVILEPGEVRVLNAKLRFITLRPIDVEATRIIRETGVDRIDPKLARFNPCLLYPSPSPRD